MHSTIQSSFFKYPEGFDENPRGHFQAKGRALLANGYSIIPIRRGEKRPAIASWQKSQLGVGDLGRYPDHGVGVLCGQGAHPIVGVDIDISHPVIGPALIAWCLEHLGDSPARVGAAPRILLVYRAAEAGWAKGHSVTFYDPADPFKPSGKKNEQQVEILGNGQQFVAYHEHPDTGREYEWVDLFGGLEFVAASGLPEVTSAQIDALHVEVMRLVRETPGVEVTGSGESPAMRPSASGSEADDLMTLTSRVGTPVDEMRALMAHVENDDANYDMWLKVGMALHHEYGGTEHDAAALQMWKDYGAQSSKDQPDQYGYKWRSFGGSAGSPTTLRWLLKIAHQGKTEAQRSVKYEAVAEWRESILTANEFAIREKLCPAAAKDARLDQVGRDQVAAAVLDRLKAVGVKVSIRQCREWVAPPLAAADVRPTHHGYALGLLARLKNESGGHDPVGADGVLYTVAPDGVYVAHSVDELAGVVARTFDGGEKCERVSDYRAVAQHAIGISDRPGFFEEAPVGLACVDGFHLVRPDGTVGREPLGPQHRQRHKHAVTPMRGPMPLFDRYLRETFESVHTNEPEAQTAFVQEVAGAIALGLMARHEKVVLLYGPGRAGKGTLLKILEELVPPESRASVSPFRWNNEYYLANLAAKRLNVVGELPDDQPIPAADFKTLTGRDRLTGRHPTHRPFTFRNEAAHVFNSNTYPMTRDHSEAFFTRWHIVGFPNSRIDGGRIETDLAAQIVRDELPAILAWALEGAQRLVLRGHFDVTTTHRKHLAAWRRRTDSLMEFLHDEDTCMLDEFKFGLWCKRKFLYGTYVDWCKGAGRSPMGLHKFNESLDSPAVAALGIYVKRDPVLRELVHGVGVRSSFSRTGVTGMTVSKGRV